MRDVTTEFHLSVVDQRELVNLLVMSFGQMQAASDKRLDFPNSDQVLLSLIFNRSGNLVNIMTNLNSDELAPTIDLVKTKLLSPTVTTIRRTILFSPLPVVGWWRSEYLTLLQVPKDAPRPASLIAEHPFLLEFTFEATTDGFLNNLRAMRVETETFLVLSMFLKQIKMTGRATNQHWGIDLGRPYEGNAGILWIQEGYGFDGYVPDPKEMSPQDSLELISSVDDISYLMTRAIDMGSRMVLPESLEKWIAKFHNLPSEAKRKFTRAAYWHNHAWEVYRISKSATLVALVQSIESLLPVIPGEKCESCGREKGVGPTQNFSDFLTKYGPLNGIGDTPAHRLLYRQRSKLAHGQTLLISDEEYFMNVSPQHSMEWSLIERAAILTQIAAINWLMDY